MIMINGVHVVGTSFSDPHVVKNAGEAINDPFFNPKRLSIKPQPDNEHDPNAIAVYFDGKHLGHLPATTAASVKDMMQRRGYTRLLPGNVSAFQREGNWGFWLDVKVSR